MGAYDPMPVHGDGDLNGQPWDPWLRNFVSSIDSRVNTLELSPAAAGTGTAGEKNVDGFAGSTDTAKLQAFISYSNAQTYKPLGRLGNRAYTWAGSIDLASAPGLSLAGPDFEREYKSTTSYKGMAASIKCRVSTTSSSGYFWGMSADAPAISMRGIHFDGGNQGHDFIQTNSGHQLVHSRWQDFGLTTYRNGFNCTVQGGSWKSFHINTLSQHAFFLNGADFTLGSMQDYQYIDNCGAGYPFVRISGDAAKILHLYITPTAAGSAIVHDGGTGTLYLGNNLDSAGQDTTTASLCQGALMQLRDGSATVVGGRLYGGMYNPAGGVDGVTYNKGLITATGGTHNIVGVNFETQRNRRVPFTKWYSYPKGTPHIYATNHAKVTVAGVSLVDDSTLFHDSGEPLNTTYGSDPKAPPSPDVLRLVQQSAGRIIIDLAPFVSVG